LQARPIAVLSASAAACCAVALFGVAPALAASRAQSQPGSDQAYIASEANLPAAQQALLNAGAPATIAIDSYTGQILSVAAAGSATPAITTRATCESTDACWETNKVPYADVGFYGTAGTVNGDWPYRSAFASGQYSASACWSLDGDYCIGTLAPHEKASFDPDVTGTSATIS
jgi:hypothetical protein